MQTYAILPTNVSNAEDCSCDSYSMNKSFKMVDRSSSLYESIKRIKLDNEFIVSVDDYLDRLKSNISKDLIRRETLLRNGKNHARHLISLIRCICQVSDEQAHGISKHPGISTMTAIHYILQRHFPQKKPLLNYVLQEYISMWLHENLRIIQEDLLVLVEKGTEKQFLPLSNCLLKKFESICAINWERLQMIQNYRLMKSMDRDWILLFGKSTQLTMKRSKIPITLLYSHRTDNEVVNIKEVDRIFRKSIAKILHSNRNEQDQTFISICEKPVWTKATETKPKQKRSRTRDSKATEIDPWIHFLTKLEELSSSMTQSFQLPSLSKENLIHNPSKCDDQQPRYWRHLNDNSITSNSLSCGTGKSFDKNMYSITIEHNEEF